MIIFPISTQVHSIFLVIMNACVNDISSKLFRPWILLFYMKLITFDNTTTNVLTLTPLQHRLEMAVMRMLHSWVVTVEP